MSARVTATCSGWPATPPSPPLAKAQDRGFRNRATVHECKPSGAPGCTVERAQPLERGRGPAAGRDQDRQARHRGRGPGRGRALVPPRRPRRAAGRRRRTAGHRARPGREADRGRGVRAPARAGRGEAFRAGADMTARTLEAWLVTAEQAAGRGPSTVTPRRRSGWRRIGRGGSAMRHRRRWPARVATRPTVPSFAGDGRVRPSSCAVGPSSTGGAAVTRDLVRRLEAAEAATARRGRGAGFGGGGGGGDGGPGAPAGGGGGRTRGAGSERGGRGAGGGGDPGGAGRDQVAVAWAGRPPRPGERGGRRRRAGRGPGTARGDRAR